MRRSPAGKNTGSRSKLSLERAKPGVFRERTSPSLALLANSCRLSFSFLPLAGLVWMRMCLMSSSDLLNRFSHPGWVQACGLSPVCVRMCRV